MDKDDIKSQADVINFLGTMTDKIKPPNKTTNIVSTDKLIELINIIDERTMDMVSSIGNDLTRILINLTSVVELLIEKKIITEEEFNSTVHKRAIEFRDNTKTQQTSNDLDDIEL